jgi:phenylpropionate dioxygenase-like ring-hydroxylating dioxygenase large terminal subunit
MTTAEENRLLTETGPGTPGGRLLRRYWQPIAKSDELPEGSAPVPIRIMSENLVLFRDEQGRVGLVQRQCPHRRADLSYGRIEDGGLRCLYHGWLYDVTGKCLQTPAEPDDSKLRDGVPMTAYPCVEVSGLIFTYMGEGAPPVFPDYEFLKFGELQRNLTKTYVDCNWLQALEGNIDPSHLSYLHRPASQVDRRMVPGSSQSADQFYKGDTRPDIDWEPTHFGIRIYSVRKAPEDKKYVRITNFLMPNKAAIVGNEGRIGEGYSVNWHTPIDDTHHIRFDIGFNRNRPLNKEAYLRRMAGEVTPNGRLVRNQANRYLQNREEMKTRTFTGMGGYFITHDSFAVETAGPIHDRSLEYLGTTDVVIVQARRQLLQAIEAMKRGEAPLHDIRRESDNDMSDLVVMSEVIPSAVDHKQAWKKKKAAPGSAAAE